MYLVSESQRNRSHFISMTLWESEKHRKLEPFSKKVSSAMSPRMALFWVPQESGEHVVGQWCNWILMKKWDFLYWMYGSMDARFEVQRTIKRATGFPLLSQESDWTHQGACRQQRTH